MYLFIATEAQSDAAALISRINRQIHEKIGDIEISDYTDNFDSVGIIINCFDEKWMSMGFGKPRVLIQYAKRDIDIRFNICHEKFMSASPSDRYLMVVQNIIRSIDAINARVSKKKISFDCERMANDILTGLSLTRLDLEKL